MTGYVPKKGLIVLYHEESTFGTKVVPSRVFGMIDDFTAPTATRSLTPKHELGTTAPAYMDEDVQKYSGGSIKFKILRPEFLEYIMGVSVDSAGPSPYTHTMGISNLISSLTIGASSVDSTGTLVKSDYYVGSLIRSVTIEARKGEPVTATVAFDCKSVESDDVALAYATQSGESPLLFKGASVAVASSAIDTVTEFTLTMERKIARTDVLNSLINRWMSSDEFTCNLSLVYVYTGTAEVTYYHGAATGTTDAAGVERSIAVTVTNGLSTTSLRSWVFTMATSKFGEYKFSGFGEHRLAGLTATSIKTCAVVCTDTIADWTA